MQHLLATIVFHPGSERCEKIAEALYQGLTQDDGVPGLKVPTVFSPDLGDTPPPLPDFTEARRHLLVLLADATLAVRAPWCAHAAALRNHCARKGQLFFPVQLHEHAHPLHPDLALVNFLRAWREETPVRLILRRMLAELCRLLENEASDIEDPRAPIRLFLSHAKAEASEEDSVFSALVGYLDRSQPVETWIDSADITTNSQFASAIAEGVERSSLLCILTDSYASREWCRREMLLAKAHQRPIVILRDVADQEVRSFPYSGNVPDMRWKGDPAEAVDMILKETVRMLLARAELEQSGAEYDDLLVSPPELVTVFDRPKGTRLIYPEPPIGLEEKELLSRSGAELSTPMEQMLRSRTLEGVHIALSHSEGTDIRKFGMTPAHLEAAALEISRHLLIKGGVLVYGGHLGSQAFTDRLKDLVVAHNARDGVPAVERIVNYLGWPIPRPDDDNRLRIQSGVTLVETPRPADVGPDLDPAFVDAPAFFSFETSAVHRYAWARGMTEMRQRQTAGISARVVLGGAFGPTAQRLPDGTLKERWSAGRMPGVLEEIFLSLRAGQPVFLLGGFGGAARLALDLAMGVERPEAGWAYQRVAPHSEALRDLYATRGQEWTDYAEIAALLRELGPGGLNPLSAQENLELARSRDPGVILPLLLSGLSKAPH